MSMRPAAHRAFTWLTPLFWAAVTGATTWWMLNAVETGTDTAAHLVWDVRGSRAPLNIYVDPGLTGHLIYVGVLIALAIAAAAFVLWWRRTRPGILWPPLAAAVMSSLLAPMLIGFGPFAVAADVPVFWGWPVLVGAAAAIGTISLATVHPRDRRSKSQQGDGYPRLILPPFDKETWPPTSP